MEKKLDSSVEDIVVSITESAEFKECIRLKEKMDKSTDIKNLVSRVKKLQQEYVKTGDSKVKEELDKVQEELDNIPLYDSYNKKLQQVNGKIDFIKDELNNYFYNVVNPKK